MFLHIGSKIPQSRRRPEFSSRTVANFGSSGINHGGPLLKGYRSLSEGRLNFGTGSLYRWHGGHRGSQDLSGSSCKEFYVFGRGPYSCDRELGGCFSRGYGGTFGNGCFSSPGIQPIQIHVNLLQQAHVDLEPNLPQLKREEKEELKHLNNQFVSFIDKVEYLKEKNTALSTKLQILQDVGTTNKKINLELVFENYIQNLQMQIEHKRSQKARLQSELRHLEHVVEDCKEMYEDEINRRIWGENQFVLLKKAVEDHSYHLLPEILKLQMTDMGSGCCMCEDVDVAYLSKTQLEAKVDALQSQVAFFREVFEQELHQRMSTAHHAPVVISMENGRELNAGSMITEYEYQYQQLAQEAKAHVEDEFQQKYEDLKENSGCPEDAARKAKQERDQLRLQIRRVRPQLDCVKMQIRRLQSAICEAEQKGELDLKDAQKKLDKLKVALQTEKKQLARILKEFQELWNIKLVMDMEITVYQKLLEGEESRLCDETPGLVTLGNDNIINSGGNHFHGGTASSEGSVPAKERMAESGATSSKRRESSSSYTSGPNSSSGKSPGTSEGGEGSTSRCRYYRIKKCIKTFIKMILGIL